MPPPAAARRRTRRGRARKAPVFHVEVFHCTPEPVVPWERDWADLPADAISCVLHKLDHVELLLGGVRAVCRSWRRAAREEPEMWRRIDVRCLRSVPPFTRRATLENIMRSALRLSAGQCHTFAGERLDDDLFMLLAERAPSLKRLQLIGYYSISNGGFANAIKKLHLLEELQLVNCYADEQVLELVAQLCRCLKHFTIVEQICHSYRIKSNINMDYNLVAKSARIFMDYYEYFPPSERCRCCMSPISWGTDDLCLNYDYNNFWDLSLYDYLDDDINGADFEEHERILDIKSMRRYLS